MSQEYLSFASKKKYKDPTLDILDQFEVEVWIGQDTQDTKFSMSHDSNSDFEEPKKQTSVELAPIFKNK